MLDGLPLHPLLVHAAVVLLAANGGALILAVVLPRFRRWLSWGLPVLGVVTGVTAWLTKSEGEELLGSREVSGALADHTNWGGWAGVVGIVLGITTVVYWVTWLGPVTSHLPWLAKPPARVVVAVLAVGVAVAAIILDVLAGHSGATSVWG
ncbi:hypothetical protein BH23ACT6_BH23ACT6_15230 [soil metagenome]